jgi:hypothetical protein
MFFLKPGLIVEDKESCGRADIRNVLIGQDELQRWRNSRPIIVVFRILQRTYRQTVKRRPLYFDCGHRNSQTK